MAALRAEMREGLRIIGHFGPSVLARTLHTTAAIATVLTVAAIPAALIVGVVAS